MISREAKLDDLNIICCENMGHEVVSISITGNNLLVYTKNFLIQSYVIKSHGDFRFSLVLNQAFSLEGFVGSEAVGVQAICRYNGGNKSSDSISNQPILLLKNGTLHMIWKKVYYELTQDSSWFATRLSRKVEHFWVTEAFDDDELNLSIWIFDGTGTKILDNPLQMVEKPLGHKDDIFVMEFDFYPFMVLLNQGIIVGVKQQVSLNKKMSISQFLIDIKTHLFVHLIIKQYLLRGQSSQALKFSSTYQQLGYFNHALEIMLHVALEEDGYKKDDTHSMIALM
jgi:hypothetical protein